MSITTRKGDTGATRLFSGEQISKSDLAPRAYGALDEAVSVVGVARALAEDGSPLGERLLTVQRDAFLVGAELATHPDKLDRLPARVDQAFLDRMDASCRELEDAIEMPKDFIVPGGTVLSAHLDHARTVFRRCERDAVVLADAGFLTNSLVLSWLNRVSDYLWLLGRQVEAGRTTRR